MSPFKVLNRAVVSSIVLLLIQPPAMATNWWDKNKAGGWNNEDTKQVQEESSEQDSSETSEVENKGKSVSSSQEDDYHQELERRKQLRTKTAKRKVSEESDKAVAETDEWVGSEANEESPLRKRSLRSNRKPASMQVEDGDKKGLDESFPQEEKSLPKKLKRKKRFARRMDDGDAKVGSDETAVTSEDATDEWETSKPKKKIKHKRNSRTLASVSDDAGSDDEVGSSRATRRSPKRYKKNINFDLFRLAIFGGYSPANVTDPSGQNSSGKGSLVNIGLNADLQLHYFGGELEAFGGAGAGKVTNIADPTVSSAVTVKQYGAMFATKGQLPFYTGSVKWTPKLGLGYGTMSETQAQANTTATSSAKTSLSGVFLIAGWDVQPVSWLVITADYARSLTASGTVNITAPQVSTDPMTASFTGASFQRIRVGGDVYLTDNFNLGVHFVQRGFNFGTGSNESQNQILGSVGLAF